MTDIIEYKIRYINDLGNKVKVCVQINLLNPKSTENGYTRKERVANIKFTIDRYPVERTEIINKIKEIALSMLGDGEFLEEQV